MARADEILVVVHPGSACGSADFNIGRDVASACRDILAADIRNWPGPIVVIDGSLSDELSEPRYRELGTAIEGALQRAASAGQLSDRLYGCDSELVDHQQAAAAKLVERLAGTNPIFTVTGCWYDPADRTGCVNGVVDVFRAAGLPATVRTSAVEMEPETEADIEHEEEMMP